MLRAVQLGLTLLDLDSLERGEVMDMIIEAENDNCEDKQLATQEDMDRF